MGAYKSPAERRRRFKICLWTTLVSILVIVVLIVGLYFGLHHHYNNSGDSLPSSPSTPPTPNHRNGTSTTSNTTSPVKLATTPAFLGNVTSNNTPDVRDCGWAGNIGDSWIITYAGKVA